jgi:hypothetical protein
MGVDAAARLISHSPPVPLSSSSRSLLLTERRSSNHDNDHACLNVSRALWKGGSSSNLWNAEMCKKVLLRKDSINLLPARRHTKLPPLSIFCVVYAHMKRFTERSQFPGSIRKSPESDSTKVQPCKRKNLISSWWKLTKNFHPFLISNHSLLGNLTHTKD